MYKNRSNLQLKSIITEKAIFFIKRLKAFFLTHEVKLSILLIITNVVSIIFVWLPFILGRPLLWFSYSNSDSLTFDMLYRYWDGPIYVVIAKTMYLIRPEDNPYNHWPYYLSDKYYIGGFSGYPLFIRLFSFMGYYNSMLFVVVVFSSFDTVLFFKLIKDFNYVENPFYIALLWIFLPPRWLLYHSVGTSEPTFLFFLMASFYFYKRERYLLSGTSAAFATITRFVGIFLFLSFLILLIRTRQFKKLPYYFLIPIAMALHFLLYHFIFGDFFIYLNASPTPPHLPFPFIRQSKNWLIYNYIQVKQGMQSYYRVRFHQGAELRIVHFIIYGTSLYLLHRKGFTEISLYCLPFYFLYCYVGMDTMRYLLTVFPMLIPYEKFLSSKKFKMMLPLILFGVYSYVWICIPDNVASHL
ncbi:MAG: hypothetical protein ACFFCD_02485 [Promethearchaeota archaeon]